MYQYQNYSMNNYVPNQNMYQMPNPYMDRIAGLQQLQAGLRQPQNHFGLNGSIVDDFAMISANDVPMDNFGAVFMKRDGSELQHRVWTSDGKILTTTYKPYLDKKEPQTEEISNEDRKSEFGALNDVIGGISTKLDALIEKIDATAKKNVKKEVE